MRRASLRHYVLFHLTDLTLEICEPAQKLVHRFVYYANLIIFLICRLLVLLNYIYFLFFHRLLSLKICHDPSILLIAWCIVLGTLDWELTHSVLMSLHNSALVKHRRGKVVWIILDDQWVILVRLRVLVPRVVYSQLLLFSEEVVRGVGEGFCTWGVMVELQGFGSRGWGKLLVYIKFWSLLVKDLLQVLIGDAAIVQRWLIILFYYQLRCGFTFVLHYNNSWFVHLIAKTRAIDKIRRAISFVVILLILSLSAILGTLDRVLIISTLILVVAGEKIVRQ